MKSGLVTVLLVVALTTVLAWALAPDAMRSSTQEVLHSMHR
jgi:hypothetical protein